MGPSTGPLKAMTDNANASQSENRVFKPELFEEPDWEISTFVLFATSREKKLTFSSSKISSRYCFLM